MTFKGDSNLQTNCNGLKMLKEVRTDSTASSKALTACVVGDTCCRGGRDSLTVLLWAQRVGEVLARPEESFPQHWGE